MGYEKRGSFQQQVVEALIESKAINLQAIGATLSKYGERAAIEGESFATIINRNVIWNCGWPIPEIQFDHGQLNQLAK